MLGCQVLIGTGEAQICGYGGTGWQRDVLLRLRDKVLNREFWKTGGLKIVSKISIPGLGHRLGIKNTLINKRTELQHG